MLSKNAYVQLQELCYFSPLLEKIQKSYRKSFMLHYWIKRIHCTITPTMDTSYALDLRT